ncbi:hypothetical protein CASFOL_035684 [Castilleja foliolosa]|uniref:Uncharacterized protein n=1 Tax=Castilleja foliolosa TaxID=1961234 RepID=A0ABD3BU13_9LAMI
MCPNSTSKTTFRITDEYSDLNCAILEVPMNVDFDNSSCWFHPEAPYSGHR